MKSFSESEIAEMEREYKQQLCGCEEMTNSIKTPDFSSIIKAAQIRDYSMADYSYEIIIHTVKDFEDGLDDDHEVAVKLASFGQSITMSVSDIGYANPSTLMFHGYVGDQPATLIQNMAQLNFLLLAVKKDDPEKPPRRIGFSLPPDD